LDVFSATLVPFLLVVLVDIFNDVEEEEDEEDEEDEEEEDEEELCLLPLPFTSEYFSQLCK